MRPPNETEAKADRKSDRAPFIKVRHRHHRAKADDD
jgi:hypothetical protein